MNYRIFYDIGEAPWDSVEWVADKSGSKIIYGLLLGSTPPMRLIIHLKCMFFNQGFTLRGDSYVLPMLLPPKGRYTAAILVAERILGASTRMPYPHCPIISPSSCINIRVDIDTNTFKPSTHPHPVDPNRFVPSFVVLKEDGKMWRSGPLDEWKKYTDRAFIGDVLVGVMGGPDSEGKFGLYFDLLKLRPTSVISSEPRPIVALSDPYPEDIVWKWMEEGILHHTYPFPFIQKTSDALVTIANFLLHPAISPFRSWPPGVAKIVLAYHVTTHPTFLFTSTFVTTSHTDKKRRLEH